MFVILPYSDSLFSLVHRNRTGHPQSFLLVICWYCEFNVHFPRAASMSSHEVCILHHLCKIVLSIPRPRCVLRDMQSLLKADVCPAKGHFFLSHKEFHSRSTIILMVLKWMRVLELRVFFRTFQYSILPPFLSVFSPN